MNQHDIPKGNGDHSDGGSFNPENIERMEDIQHELADVALEQTGIEGERSEESVDVNQMLKTALEEVNLDTLREISPDTLRVLTELRYMVEDAQHMLARANYEGAEYARQIAPQIADTLDVLRQRVAQIDELSTSATTGTRRTEQGIDETTLAVKAANNEAHDDDVAYKLRHLDEAVAELGSASRLMASGHDEMGVLVAQHGLIDRALHDLQHDSWGHETAIAQIRHGLQQFEDSLSLLHRGATYLETAVADLDRIRK